MADLFESLQMALRCGDAEAVFEQDFITRKASPNEELTEEIIPSNPSWAGSSLARSFALLFIGHEWGEKKWLSPFYLLEQLKEGRTGSRWITSA